jgi:hypothetical protein
MALSYPRSLFLNNILALADSKAGAEKVQGEPGMSHCARKQQSVQRLIGSCQKDTGSHERTGMKGSLLTELDTIEQKK